MIFTRSKTVFSYLLVVLASLLLFACGGNGTYSPSVTGTTGTVTPPAISVSISPSNPSTYPGGTIQFSATVTGTSNKAVTWTVVTSGGGTISSTGLYTAPAPNYGLKPGKAVSARTLAPFISGAQYTVEATSQADPTKTASAVVSVSDVAVTITPANPTVIEGQTVQFSAVVSGASNQTVSWYGNDGGGTINQTTGLFTAGFKPGTYQILAYPQVEPGLMGFQDVTVVPPAGISVSITPSTSTTAISGSPVQLTAKVNGSTDQNVTWSIVTVNGVQYGSVTQTGLYTPYTYSNSQSNMTITVQAVSEADPTKTGTATIQVLNQG